MLPEGEASVLVSRLTVVSPAELESMTRNLYAVLGVRLLTVKDSGVARPPTLVITSNFLRAFQVVPPSEDISRRSPYSLSATSFQLTVMEVGVRVAATRPVTAVGRSVLMNMPGVPAAP